VSGAASSALFTTESAARGSQLHTFPPALAGRHGERGPAKAQRMRCWRFMSDTGILDLTCHGDQGALADAVQGARVFAILGKRAVHEPGTARQRRELGAEADEAARRRTEGEVLLPFALDRLHAQQLRL